MLQRMCLVILLAGLFGTTPGWAAQLTRPQVEYSADSVMQTEDGAMEQRVYITPVKERHELLTGDGDGAVQIFRFDNKIIVTLMPSEKMYMENSMGANTAQDKSNDMSQWDFQETEMGQEVLNGMKVTKYKTIATSTDGKKYGGFSWRTKEGISLKTDLLYKEGNEKHRMTTELKNLKIGKQDPKLFEVPRDYTKFDMAGMMGGMGDLMSGEGKGRSSRGQPGMNREKMGRPNLPAPDDAQTSPEPTGEDRSDLEKAGGMLKKLFGQ